VFSVDFRETGLYINGFYVVDLKKPFHRIVGHEDRNIETILRAPSETLREKKPLTYYVKFSQKKAGALFRSEVMGLKCHWLYNTNTSISPLFRDKALLTLLNTLDTPDMDAYAEVRRYLSTILRLLWKSYPFDCVFTSLRTIPLLLPEVPVVVQPLRLMRLPKNIFQPSVRYKTLAAVLQGHPEGIPLSLLTGESYKFLALRHTTFNKDELCGYKNILILEGTNTSYAGFLAREFTFISGIQECLPSTLFHIGV
jgi:hypothetical protein